jgi:hypothetical protein
MQVESLDRWQWRPDPAMGYSVHDAYQILTSQDSVTLGEAEDLLWHREVPLKVSIFAWRLLRDRLPIKTNLVSRGILAPDLHDCVAGYSGIETARHLFLSCSTFGSLWALVRSWIGFSAVDAYSLTDHFIQFIYSAGGLRARRSFLQLFWLACVWVVWNERNLRLFRNSGTLCISSWTKSSFFLSVVADDGCYFSYQLSSLVVEPIALFEHRLIVFLFYVTYLNSVVNFCSTSRYALC